MPDLGPGVRTSSRLMWFGLFVTILLLLLALLSSATRLTRSPRQALPVLAQVKDFRLTNQNNLVVTLGDLAGTPWFADIIFTRCAGPCPVMTRQMRELQRAIPSSSKARLVTLTTDPKFDTPEILSRYAQRFGADSGRWMFLTGAPEQIAALAIDSLKLVIVEKKPEERQDQADLFIHSTLFVLVDRKARLRGVYETSGEGINPDDVRTRMMADLRRVEAEQ